MYHFVVHLKHCKSTTFQFKKLKIKKEKILLCTYIPITICGHPEYNRLNLKSTIQNTPMYMLLFDVHHSPLR